MVLALNQTSVSYHTLTSGNFAGLHLKGDDSIVKVTVGDALTFCKQFGQLGHLTKIKTISFQVTPRVLWSLVRR
jgi:hypothetical protein